MKKRMMLSLLLAASLVFVLLVPSFAANQQGTVTGSYVNVRSGPGTSYSILGGYYKGSPVTVVQTTDGWCEILYNGGYGYISAEYVEITASPDPGTPVPPVTPGIEHDPNTGLIISPVVNLRSGPAVNYTVLTLVTLYEQVTIVERQDKWYKVKFGSIEGYIYYEHIRDYGDDGSGSGEGEGTESSVKHGVVTANLLNLRAGPSSSSDLKGTLSGGDLVTIIGEDGEWYQVQVGANVYYAAKSYIQLRAALDPADDIKVGAVTSSTLNVRIGPSTAHFKIATINKNDRMKITAIDGTWYKIDIADEVGYVSSEYVKTIYDPASPPRDPDLPAEPVDPEPVDPSAPIDSGITVAAANLRKTAAADAESLASIPLGTFVDIYAESGEWYRVDFGGVKGYVKVSELIKGVSPYVRPAGSPSENGAQQVSGLTQKYSATIGSYNSAAGNEIVEFAKTLLGIPYVYGGDTPEEGFDCSGFTQYVYNSLGYNIPRLQQCQQGAAVAYEDMRPGDLVGFTTNGYPVGHVGIYIGDGLFIHAPTTGSVVSISDMTSGYYYDRFVAARRLSK